MSAYNPCIDHKVTDDEARWLYAALIGMSWADGGAHFEVCQKAWETLAAAEGIREIQDNGHGRVIRK